MALGAAIFPEAARFLKYFSIKCPPNIPFMRIMAHLRVQSSSLSLDLGAAELYVFLIRLELLAGFIFARV